MAWPSPPGPKDPTPKLFTNGLALIIRPTPIGSISSGHSLLGPFRPQPPPCTRPIPPGGSEGVRFGEASHPGPQGDRNGQKGEGLQGPGGRHTARRDLPEARAVTRGTLPALGSASARQAMLAEYKGTLLVPSTRAPRDSLWRTRQQIISCWEMGTPLHLSVGKVHAVGATLMAGGYKSHTNYTSRLHSEAQRGERSTTP